MRKPNTFEHTLRKIKNGKQAAYLLIRSEIGSRISVPPLLLQILHTHSLSRSDTAPIVGRAISTVIAIWASQHRIMPILLIGNPDGKLSKTGEQKGGQKKETFLSVW